MTGFQTLGRGRTLVAVGAVGAMAVTALIAPAVQAVGPSAQEPDPEALEEPRPGWKLKYEEKFSQRIKDKGAEWVLDDLSAPVDHHDDNGPFWQVSGGQAFADQLATFDIYRKSFAFGQDDWLTVELETRDHEKDGDLGETPTVTKQTLPGVGPVGRISVPTSTDGALIRSSEPLPSQYRVEYKLKTIDFGGERDGTLEYDGKVNGYNLEGCKTRHPWDRGQLRRDPGAPYCEWRDVTGDSNGFYFLSIMDYADPAPRNNTFIHSHRKVNMDAFNHLRSNNGDVCNPATGEFYPHRESTRNGVNMIFLSEELNDLGTSNAFIQPSECTGSPRPNDVGAISQVELQPELMPKEDYTFAVERTETGYTLEVSGNFRFVGQQTYRYHRKFIDDDGHAIWHYNNTPDEYDGRFDDSRTVTGPHGSYEIPNIWPSDSAYPDNFIIGIPHTNFYEGQAEIDDLRLYVPRRD